MISDKYNNIMVADDKTVNHIICMFMSLKAIVKYRY